MAFQSDFVTSEQLVWIPKWQTVGSRSLIHQPNHMARTGLGMWRTPRGRIIFAGQLVTWQLTQQKFQFVIQFVIYLPLLAHKQVTTQCQLSVLTHFSCQKTHICWTCMLGGKRLTLLCSSVEVASEFWVGFANSSIFFRLSCLKIIVTGFSSKIL